ncbi:hypothetical protein GCM10010435_37480 [Winogradskya consettensis]|uniref:Uncharacterized protein n=1 Tax=Winogradskya consettensis TaxID=113560 RepID=A0A919T118_9ACTN|nr:hypothetical protein [Actinoplanes consettensis]GIM83864.1 hypothetical protein Aco04nite_88620 [Actinoplanes consettensis]
MTDISALHVESQALVSYGTERYEDSVTYSAIRRYLDDIGAVPTGAWGTLPGVSDRLARDWQTSLGYRVDEALDAKNEMDRMTDGLLQVATDYEGTDLEVSTSFDVVNQDLKPYLPVADGYASTINTRRGGAGVLNSGGDPHLHGEERPSVVIPPDNTNLTATRHETIPSTRAVTEPITIGSSDGNNLGFSGGRTTYYENGGGDRLDEFVTQYRSDLLQLEAFLTELETGIRLPLNDLIIHAWRSAPDVVKNRADLLHSVANTYAETRTNFDAETDRLALYWEGTASEAFTQYAKSTSTWLTQVQAQATWLAEEGKKAASMLEGLRNAYASTGFERINTLLDAMSSYIEAVNAPFSACTNPEKALIEVALSFVNVLTLAEKNAISLSIELLKIDEQERKERPDLGTRGHDAVPLPAPAFGSTSWGDRNGWKTNPERPDRA